MRAGYSFIEDEAALDRICEQLKGSSWLAIDTEFEREKTFYPELCLLQVANAETTAVIDPLVIENLQSLFDLLYDRSITKVFHAARQDLEIFFNMRGAVPQPLFDTQIAAPLIGYDEQIGYANLVNKMLGVALSKAHTRTDWKRRPLQEAQLQYAADDVIYLGQIYSLLVNKLDQNKRLDWLNEDFSALCDVNLYQPDTETVWVKNRGAKNLKGKKLCALQHLSAWRERQARAENRPRNWLMRDDTLLDLARLQPLSLSDLERIKGLNDRQIKKYGMEILKIVSETQDLNPIPHSNSRSRKPLNIQEEALVDVLSAIVRLVADNNNLHPNKLAPRKELEKLVQSDPDTLLLKSWREQLIGNDLVAFLEGKTSFQVVDNALVCKLP